MTTEETKQKLAELEAAMAAPDFWADKNRAQEVVREYQTLKDEIENGESGGYDRGDAIITIFSGAGGDDAEDFSRMLYEMYNKWVTAQGFESYLVHDNQNDHGGYRNLTFEVRGKPKAGSNLGPYGKLKGESGVHRLVRVSPFSAKKLRHTSFSLVEVIPKLPKTKAVEIPETDLKIEFSRSSGPGGQNVNKRETAVRLVHLPTGLSAHSSNERSQERNRDQALDVLKGKLHKRQEEERLAREQGMYISKTTEIEWGNQIRSYVLHPYQLVKDHRSGVEDRDVEKVLGGDISTFIPN